jgi:hypothetical protein
MGKILDVLDEELHKDKKKDAIFNLNEICR